MKEKVLFCREQQQGSFPFRYPDSPNDKKRPDSLKLPGRRSVQIETSNGEDAGRGAWLRSRAESAHRSLHYPELRLQH